MVGQMMIRMFVAILAAIGSSLLGCAMCDDCSDDTPPVIGSQRTAARSESVIPDAGEDGEIVHEETISDEPSASPQASGPDDREN
jgi:hypothetical protein